MMPVVSMGKAYSSYGMGNLSIAFHCRQQPLDFVSRVRVLDTIKINYFDITIQGFNAV